MARLAPLALALLLAACAKQDSLENARSRYLMMIANHAPAEDLCAEAKDNARIAAHALSELEYRYWIKVEKTSCDLADPPK